MSSAARLWISPDLDRDSSVAEHIEYAAASAYRTQKTTLDLVEHHFRSTPYSVLGDTGRTRGIVVQLPPETLEALRKLDELISERRKSPRKVDPFISACQNFVRGNPLMDPTAPLIGIILGDVDGTVFEPGAVPDASISQVSTSLAKALEILMERTRGYSEPEETEAIEAEETAAPASASDPPENPT